jgi:hypothetical protein
MRWWNLGHYFSLSVGMLKLGLLLPRRTILSMSIHQATTTTGSQLGPHWTKQLKAKQLKRILHTKPAAAEALRGCVEWSDLDALAQKHVSSLEEAETILSASSGAAGRKETMGTAPVARGASGTSTAGTATTTDHSTTEEVLMQLKQILGQDRGVVNYTHYNPSAEHLERMKKFTEIKPHMFDNPKVTPRHAWFTNPAYRRSQQMPDYHVHFREEMQEAARSLYEAYATTTPSQQHRAIRQAHGYLQGCLSGLHGHVGIEEHSVFPKMQRQNPDIDLEFLFRDHGRLDRTEKQVMKELKQLLMNSDTASKKNRSNGLVLPREDIVAVLRSVLNFDTLLMTHLGEEEDVVVPITLTTGTF